MVTPDVLIIGAGFAGSVMAERFAAAGKHVLIIEKKAHLGGHCHDYRDQHGILIHSYGPHIFHTNSQEAWDYVSRFTSWVPYQHKVLAWVEGKRVPIPFNFNSLYALFPRKEAEELEKRLLTHFDYGTKIPVLELQRKAKEVDDERLVRLADYIFENIFRNYTKKQWGEEPEALSGVLERVPILLSRDNRYFQDRYQAMPSEGYTKIFERMLAHENINIMLKTDYHDVLSVDIENGTLMLFDKAWRGIVVFTGRLDEFFNEKHGKLPYRSLRFEKQERPEKRVQEVPVENYPNQYAFTRSTEFKLFYPTKRDIPGTTLFYEYPLPYDGTNDPYYPIPKQNTKIVDLYKQEVAELQARARKSGNTFLFVGRLAEYRYYNMDQVVSRALELFKD